MKQIAGKMKQTIFCGLLAMLVTSAARADVWAYTDPGPGSQTGNPGILLAQPFTVNFGSISVTNIGAFVANGTSLSGEVVIAIVNSMGTVVAGTETDFIAGNYSADPFNGLDTYTSVTATLGTGSYWLEALGYENPGVPPNYNGNTCPHCGFSPDPAPVTNTDGGVLSFSGLSAYTLDATGFGKPAVPDLYADGEPQYQIGTFSYSYVPDGGMTLMLLGGALTGLAILRRKLSA